MSDLNLRITADTGGAESNLRALGTRLKEAGDRAAGFTSKIKDAIPALTALPTVTAKAGAAIQKMGTDAKAGSDRASQALLNLGRVAQDAPFGIIGIANNINPLLESFQRLRAESGSAGEALKKLAGGLIGGGGLGLAVSVVTGLLSFFALNANRATESVKTLADENREFFQSLKDVESVALATGLKLQTFVDIARNGQLPLKERNEALKEANKILGEHGEKLTLVNINTQKVTESIKAFTEATIQQALANKLADRAADLLIKQRDATIKLTEAQSKQSTALTKAFTDQRKVSLGRTGGQVSLAVAEEDVKKATKGLQEVNTELNNIKAGLQAAQSEATRLFGSLGTKTKEVNVKKVKIKPEEIEFNAPAFKIPVGLTIPDGAAKDLVQQLKNGAFGARQGIVEIDKILDRKGIVAGLQTFNDSILRFFQVDFLKDSTGALYEKFKAITDLIAEQGKMLTDLTQDIITGFAEGIGNALGGGSIKEAFQGLFSTVGGALQKLGVQAIAASKLFVALRLAFRTLNPIVGLGAGIGLIALGSFLKAAANNKFATGVQNFQGGFATVGERGPETVFLPKGASVATNGQMNAMQSTGQSVNVTGEFIMRNDVLYLAVQKGGRQVSRNGG